MNHLSLSANPSRVWSVDVGEGTGSVAHLLAQPIVVGDTVYTMDSRSLVSAFAATDGTRRWQVDVEDEDEDAGFFGGGIASDGDKIFVSTGFARIFALDTQPDEQLCIHTRPPQLRGAPAVVASRALTIAP